ncbi:hypothetical protein UCRPA7_3648 [Phaeoacremonium minimum UCRPA7]|uniref:Uncharacterized protein n=1 Tax=Phaeoacremonium minimum (strain UCR-PA7) TaxID=1286976 RepID=R8BN05_PHAM7|nr:hypothetical protein UCRPA7_3648 [Phaeoacremonium minimum UCRPA7]EOO00712.1 hypothetical protein UCRPA7_3648 [Phaeoacremonium minimum UCRPA7]
MSRGEAQHAPPLQVPEISQTDLYSFHEAHFSHDALNHFKAQFFTQPGVHEAQEEAADQDYEYLEEEDDDGLGYYDDGVKRTLTDEQIAMFRHSEIEALRRAQAISSSARKASTPLHTNADDQDLEASDAMEQLSEGEVSTPQMERQADAPKKKKKKRGKGKSKDPGPKIDLRKRTWDVVDTGLGSLDYDEAETPQAKTANAPQRRRISYDDD